MIEDEDVGESPLQNYSTSTRFQPGKSGNPSGRPKGKKNDKPRSRMRSTLARLYEIQDDAIELIRQSMTGKDVNGFSVEPPPKDKVDMAKFVVKTIESLNNTCLREEMAIQGVREKNPDNAQELEDNQKEEVTATNFSLDMLESSIKH